MKQRSFEMIETNGVRLRTVVEGKGPLCVLVHGWPESWYSFRHQIDPLVAAGYRVAVPDVRGYGGSDKPYAIEAYAMKSVRYLGRGGRPTIDVFREVYKGRFFYQIYFQEPGVAEAELEADVAASIRKIYFSSSGDAPPGQGGLSGHKDPNGTLLQGLVDPKPLPAWLTEADVAYYAEQFRASGFRGPLNRYRNQERDHAMLPELSERKVEQPALFIAGTRDPVLSFMPGLNLADLMDRFYTDLRGKVMIQGAGHWVQQERPAEVNEALLRFLRLL